MPGLSYSLNQSSLPVIPTAGNIVLSFPAPNVGRIWQGTIVVPNAPGGSVWAVTIGGFVIVNLAGGGPFGPFQIQSGQVVQLKGTGAGSNQLIAYILGVDDPSDNPSPYSGPGALPSPAAPSNVTIIGPVDGAGNVKVDIAAGLANPLPVNAAITSPLDGSGNVLVDIASGLTNPLPVSPSPQLPRYSMSSFASALSAASTETLWYLEAGSTKAYVTDISITMNANTALPAIRWDLYRVITVGSPVGTPGTIRQFDSLAAAPTCTGLITLSAEPTTVAILDSWFLQPFGGGLTKSYRIDLEECPILNTSDNPIGLRAVVPALAGCNCITTVTFAQ